MPENTIKLTPMERLRKAWVAAEEYVGGPLASRDGSHLGRLIGALCDAVADHDRRLAAVEGRTDAPAPEPTGPVPGMPDAEHWETVAQQVWEGREIGATKEHIIWRIQCALTQAHAAGRRTGLEEAVRVVDDDDFAPLRVAIEIRKLIDRQGPMATP